MANQADAQSRAEDGDAMDTGTPEGARSWHTITAPTPQHADGQVKLVEGTFNFSYSKDPVCASTSLQSIVSSLFCLGPRERGDASKCHLGRL